MYFYYHQENCIIYMTAGLLLSQFINTINLSCPLMFNICLSMVQVTVTPNDKSACKHFGYNCSPASVTLHDKNTLVLPADPPDHRQPAGNAMVVQAHAVCVCACASHLLGAFVCLHACVQLEEELVLLCVCSGDLSLKCVHLTLDAVHFRVCSAHVPLAATACLTFNMIPSSAAL